MVVKGVMASKIGLCTYCGLTGHIANKYYKLHGYPLGYKPKGGNKAMANQVASMQTLGNCGLDILSPNLHSGFLPTRVLQNVGVQSSGACIQSNIASQNHVGHSVGVSYVQASPQVPLSQAQCEQFLNFLKTYMASRLGNDA